MHHALINDFASTHTVSGQHLMLLECNQATADMNVDYETTQKIQGLGSDVLIGVAEGAALNGLQHPHSSPAQIT